MHGGLNGTRRAPTGAARLRRPRWCAGFWLAFALTTACGDTASTPTEPPAATPTSADRARFVGAWAGSYACPGASATRDRLVVGPGTGALDLRIVIHADFFNPDTVSGTLTAKDRVTVPTQQMGGLPGTADLVVAGTSLTYRQSGLGITCGGTDYARVP
jgi:hypothetical protein